VAPLKNIDFEADKPLRISFDDVDHSVDGKGRTEQISAPKTVARLEEISEVRNVQRKLEEAESDDCLTIGDEVKLELDSLGATPPGHKSIGLDIETLS
jgi:hypothetical protein